MLVVGLLLLQTATPQFLPPSPALRTAQARFESVRRMHLPVQHGPGGRCDVRVGRFCYWSDSAPPPPTRREAAGITRARETLLRELMDAAERWPADPWVAGQRVRYLLDAGRADSAAKIPCAAEGWWCASLRGLALHVAGAPAAADSAFERALALMPERVRCEWMDLEDMLEDPLAKEFARADCAERPRLAALLWRLQQPLWMQEGNEARSEHIARETMAVILAGSGTAHGTRWGSDMRELLRRYGWAESYTRSPPSGIDPLWSVLGHDREPNWSLVPRMRSLHSPWIAPDAWSLRDSMARSRMAPRTVTSLLPLTHVLVRIPREDSTLLVAGVRTPGQFGRDTVDLALAVLSAGTLRSIPAPGGAAAITIPGDTGVVSVEAFARGSRRAARARYSIAPLACRRASLCVSDLLLYQGPDSASLEAALARALISTAPAGKPLGIWWHVRGSSGTLTMTLAVEPLRTGLRQTAEALRLARRSSSTRLRWQAPLHGDSASAQVAVRLPAGASGRYRVSLTVQAPGHEPATSARVITVQP